ncbi:MAG: class II fructose-bisphosphate aldolase [Spirochaetota bacterium]|nr:MAG: class II fructose-bisphosphate aldolase [Spirochaetota bacterium]
MSEKITSYMIRAYQKGILIPAFNAAYPEMVKPICDTLKRLETFGLCEVARPDIEKFGAIGFDVIFDEYKRHADPEYVSLHQDHVPVIDEDGLEVDYMKLLKQAIDLEYDSIMVDGSRLPLEENIRITREIVEIAHAKKIPVEAELGAVLGHESGPLPPYEELFESGAGFTRPEDAKRLVKETGVDWLSVSVGNIHGRITGAAKDKKKVEARLSIPHLKKIKDATGIPLVLHGGSGIKREYLLQAIENGLTKINIGTDIRQAYERTVRETGNKVKAQEEVSKHMEYLIVDYYNIKGSLESLKG